MQHIQLPLLKSNSTMKIFLVSLLVVAVTAGDLATIYKKHEKRGVLYGAPALNVGFDAGFGGGNGLSSGFVPSLGPLHHDHSSYAPSFAVKHVGYNYKAPSVALPLPVAHHVAVAHTAPVVVPAPAPHYGPPAHHVHVAHAAPVHHHHVPVAHHAPKFVVTSNSYAPLPVPHTLEVPPPVLHHVQPLAPAPEPVHVHQHIAFQQPAVQVHQPAFPVHVHQPVAPVHVHESVALPLAPSTQELTLGTGFGTGFGNGLSFGSGNAGHDHHHHHGGSHGSLSPPSTSYGVPNTDSGNGYSYPAPSKKFTF